MFRVLGCYQPKAASFNYPDIAFENDQYEKTAEEVTTFARENLKKYISCKILNPRALRSLALTSVPY